MIEATGAGVVSLSVESWQLILDTGVPGGVGQAHMH